MWRHSWRRHTRKKTNSTADTATAMHPKRITAVPDQSRGSDVVTVQNRRSARSVHGPDQKVRMIAISAGQGRKNVPEIVRRRRNNETVVRGQRSDAKVGVVTRDPVQRRPVAVVHVLRSSVDHRRQHGRAHRQDFVVVVPDGIVGHLHPHKGSVVEERRPIRPRIVIGLRLKI